MRPNFRLPIGYITGIFVGGVILVAILSAPPSSHASVPPRSDASYNSGAQIASPYPPGVPAIHPRAGSFSASTPAFTATDVSAYASTHSVPHAHSAGKPAIIDVEFLSASSVSARLGGSNMGRPDDALLCYVALKGDFTFLGPQGTTVTFHEVAEVFDAHSGNLLEVAGIQ